MVESKLELSAIEGEKDPYEKDFLEEHGSWIRRGIFQGVLGLSLLLGGYSSYLYNHANIAVGPTKQNIVGNFKPEIFYSVRGDRCYISLDGQKIDAPQEIPSIPPSIITAYQAGF